MKKIVITKTPLRVSFVGGGTDFSEYFNKYEGKVVSTSINKYIYVTVKKHSKLFNEQFRLNYSESESVKSIDQIKNETRLSHLALVKQSRLSVMPIDKKSWTIICNLGGIK